ncbi:MAG: RHS repeat protein, partial [Candidatus Phytoplasma sp.]|nr:RHS repeat protein [Phytoplasma sp.]
MIGAWAKANASPNTAINGINRGRFFSLEVHITKENDDDSIGTVSYYLPFNANTNDWQHQMIAIEIPYKTFEVTVVLKYQGTGVALFDNVQLYHDNLKTDYRYDGSNGNLLEKKSASGTTSYTYDSSYRVTSITENNQRLDISHAYNGIYQLSMNNVKANYTYNAKNQISETILGDQSKAWFKSSIGYTNDFQYINSTTDAFGNQTNYQVNHLTSLIDMIENANLDKTYFSYDNYGNLIRQEEIETITGASIIKDMGYDSSHRLEPITIDGITYQFSYDSLDRVTNIKIAGIDYVTLNYLSENHNNKSYQTHKVSTQTYANNDSYGFIYDDEDNLVKISLNGTDLYSYSYDQKNRLTMYQDLRQNNIYFYSYDLAGRIEEIIDQNENRISYSYDGLGNLNSSDYTYQGINRKVYYIYNQYTGEYDYTYYEVGDKEVRKIYNIDPEDSLRRISEINLVIGNSLNISQAFSYQNPNNANGNTSLLVEKINYKKNGVIETTHAFKYDKLLNITEITLTGKTNESYNYTYDGFNRLIREDITLDNYQRTITYSYDMRGNILSIKTYYKNKITETPLKETIYRYNQGAWKDQIRSILYLVNGIEIKEEVYTYDQIGNVISITQNQISNLTIPIDEVVSRNYHYETQNLVEPLALNPGYNQAEWKYNETTGYYDYIGSIPWARDGRETTFNIDLPGRNIIVEYSVNRYKTELEIDPFTTRWTSWLPWHSTDNIPFSLVGKPGYQSIRMGQVNSYNVSAGNWLKVRYKDLNTAPKITGEQKILNNIDNPYTVNEIIALANLKVYDDFQGDLSHALIVISDNYTQNKQKVGTYELIFRAENSGGLYDEFRLEVENKKITNPKIIGPNQSSQSLGQGFNETTFLNDFRATNNFNEHLNISLIESNHIPNQAGDFELILKASDDYGNETYFIHHLEVYINQPTEEPMTQSFTWEGRRLIKHIIDGRVHEYTYNDQGIRTSKKVDGILTEYFLEGNKVLVEKTEGNVIYYTYDVEGEILSMNYLGEEYFYIKNMQGD